LVPTNTYEEKNILNPLKMWVHRIHVGRNHCILYRDDYAELQKCPNCDASHYKSVWHGYPWVPTDQGPRGPCQVDLTCQKTSRPASGPADLIRNLGNLGRPRTTLSRSRATCQACGASLPLDHNSGAASRPEDRGILSVITEGDLPKSVTDPDEGPPTSDGNPSPPAI
jgi:hypothetical protein